jgi:colanic acid/amylovoran biosynthesis glycosyltransferase
MSGGTVAQVTPSVRVRRLTVAYLANEFPSSVEPYVGEEIAELRRRGVSVVTGSMRKPKARKGEVEPTDVVVMQSLATFLSLRHFSLRAFRLGVQRRSQLAGLLRRILFEGNESSLQRMKALLHTWLGACYAAQLEGRNVEHIHVHHAYFAAWVAMVAAKLLDIQYSLTLHGSDLLVRATYLDTKLENCAFCLTISEFNRNYILEHYPAVNPEKISVSRLGVAAPFLCGALDSARLSDQRRAVFRLLAVGRLHRVKDHAFLIHACASLRRAGVEFECAIAGEGPERRNLERLIRELSLERHVMLPGHIGWPELGSVYDRADLVVLTSRSEGLPLVLMEAMARKKLVLAPNITAIPELVIPGETGFLYQARSMHDLLSKLLLIYGLMRAKESGLASAGALRSCDLDQIRERARLQVREKFDRTRNLHSFADTFLALTERGISHAHPVLQ